MTDGGDFKSRKAGRSNCSSMHGGRTDKTPEDVRGSQG